MSHNDELKRAMEDIKKILKKYDVAGTFTLVSKTHAEFLYHLPSWSVFQWNAEGDGMDIRSKKADFKNKEEQEKILEQSVHIVMQNRDISAQTFDMFDTVYKALEKYIKIEHKSFSGFEPYKANG